jgi:hypothetical protein
MLKGEERIFTAALAVSTNSLSFAMALSML